MNIFLKNRTEIFVALGERLSCRLRDNYVVKTVIFHCMYTHGQINKSSYYVEPIPVIGHLLNDLCFLKLMH